MSFLHYLNVLTPKQRARLVPIFILTVLSSGLEVFGLGLLIPFFQYLSDPLSITKLPAPIQDAIAALPGTTPQETAMWMAALLVAVFVFKGLLSVFTNWVQNRTVFRLYRETAVQVLNNHLNAPITYLTSRNSADVIRVVANDTQMFFTNYIVPLISLMAELVPLVAIVVAMLVIDPVVTLVAALCLGGFAGLILSGLRKTMLTWGRKRRDAFGGMMRWVGQGIGGIKEVQVLGAQPYIAHAYDDASKDFAHASIIHGIAQSAPRYALEVIVVATLVGFTAILQSSGEPVAIWMPRLVFFGAAAIRLAPAAIRGLNYVNTLRGNQAMAEAVYEGLLALPKHVAAERVPGDAFAFTSSVTFGDVTVTYPNATTPALDGLNLTIHHGTTVAFVGPTGAGKTTAVDVLLGLIRPDSGAVRIDGQAITGQEQRWQPRLGYVPQFIYLADLTIRENIAFGVPPSKVSDAQVWKALEFAAIDDFVQGLPDGIDTRVGERGVMLSGGQRQRLGIARALYFEPELLVMDEATSALDSDTEQRIAEATQRLQGATTMVLIAHRLTTVRHADKIVVFDAGKVADEGTFDELLERSELFRKLARGLEGVEADA